MSDRRRYISAKKKMQNTINETKIQRDEVNRKRERRSRQFCFWTRPWGHSWRESEVESVWRECVACPAKSYYTYD